MRRSRMSRATAASVAGDLRQTGPAEDALSQAHRLEEESYDLALRIMSLESQDGKTEQVLLAREALHQMDEHLTWVDQHGRQASDKQVWAEVAQARIRALQILDILALA